MTQRCAMHPPEFKKNTARSPVHSWEVKELAPGCAELGLHWHDGVKQKVPLGEYASHDTVWKAHKAEEERERRARRASAATDAMLAQFGEDEEMEEEFDAAPHIAPYDPNGLYVHYEDAALQECLRAWKPDEPQRQAAADALMQGDLEQGGEASGGEWGGAAGGLAPLTASAASAAMSGARAQVSHSSAQQHAEAVGCLREDLEAARRRAGRRSLFRPSLASRRSAPTATTSSRSGTPRWPR